MWIGCSQFPSSIFSQYKLYNKSGRERQTENETIRVMMIVTYHDFCLFFSIIYDYNSSEEMMMEALEPQTLYNNIIECIRNYGKYFQNCVYDIRTEHQLSERQDILPTIREHCHNLKSLTIFHDI